ncbi:hypothetical protein [Nitratireductor sp. XY-223]|uniref:hypothetical protein n=1 Tax=Nitratireductor sp. XY-223 TaxID=2561926 RepID=UPI0010A9B172|nr:hypothetical protein [Nitratireductor sp. XY-223]
MPTYISPLDRNFISLKRAALLIARDRAGVEPDEIMDLFKHALFTGEFECEETNVAAEVRSEVRNLPLMQIETPRVWRLLPRLAPECQPQEFFAVKAATVGEILVEREALPGRLEDWSPFTAFPRSQEVVDDFHHALAHTPYDVFPARAHAILGDIHLSLVKLHTWMSYKRYDLPAFLQQADLTPLHQQARPALRLVHSRTEDTTGKMQRGRPRKAAWARIEALVRELHAANPETPRSVLAFDAHKIAAQEFDEKDLPSLETIQRRMKTILYGPPA